MVGKNRAVQVAKPYPCFSDGTEQTVTDDFGFDRQFFNSVPANGVLIPT
jgi:hypothetical protein